MRGIFLVIIYLIPMIERVKIIGDIKLTPLSLAVWYCDDGILQCINEIVTICTDFALLIKNVVLQDMIKYTFGLKHVDVRKTNYCENKFRIVISKASFSDFIDLIKGLIPTKDMLYKVDLARNIINPVVDEWTMIF